VAIIEHKKMPKQQRDRSVKYLLKILQVARAVHGKLEGRT
jgi:hypothetical protein